MAVELIFSPEATTDLQEAYDWYEARTMGRGEDFLVRVDACIQSILRLPESYAPFHGDFRRALVRKFPYAVFYEYARNAVTIYGVLHTSRDPAKWRERLP
ncbi:Plasmid stabilization system protein [Aquisphaera giovannonii]|uniref:Plasmid stabilization system protein n=1 Tax=Aquisphaera giovannonii TaxID=406548 RepID=A0A5B9VVU6_9BACT|nr:type II toxin-antitoxin system RelE/ParE family toxin [Aquisphaera giovannonii]QEH32194.1 Plasmid stabilization system protein [Aquisphaera giovannonii]